MNPYCFVITSFSIKSDIKDLQAKFESKDFSKPLRSINFDHIYTDLLVPAIEGAGLEPLIERLESSMGSIQKTMYEKIVLCEYCIADLTNANPNAYYELGMRYAVKPFTTIPIIASSHFPLPFDVGFNRTFMYHVDDNFNLNYLAEDIAALTAILVTAKKSHATDSPLYDMVNGIAFQNSVAHEKTDVFRDKVQYDETIKQELAYARLNGNTKAEKMNAIQQVIDKYSPLENIETAVLIDMMISFKNIEAYAEMLAFIQSLPRYVSNTILVQEQQAFTLNRLGSKAIPVDEVMITRAENLLRGLEKAGNASSETYGIWGRIYKDKYDRAYKAGSKQEAKVHLQKALLYYEKGFKNDLRDAYPGVNYVTCLELTGDTEKARRVVPVVECAARAKMERKEPDYWDYATLLELAVIERRYAEASKFFWEAKPLANHSWMLGTTRDNLLRITEVRNERSEDTTAEVELLQLLPAQNNE